MKPRITKNQNPHYPLARTFPWVVTIPGGYDTGHRTHAAALGIVRRYYQRLGAQQDYAKAGR